MSASDRIVQSAILVKEDGTPVAFDNKGVNIIGLPDYGIARGAIVGAAGTPFGYASTSATSIVSVRGTTYTEPSSAQQMSIVSSSTSDAAAGTGAQTIEILYYDGTGAGPFTETVIMNGTTPVLTVSTNIRFIERLRVLTAGSNGSPVGTISLKNSGGTNTFGSISIGDNQTSWAHHYVGVNRISLITRIFAGCSAVSGYVFLRQFSVLISNAAEIQCSKWFRCITGQPSQMWDMQGLYVPGPSRITLYTKPDATTASNTYGAFSYYDV
jgi:hypothetical protein